MSNSTCGADSRKPKKPTKDYPLFPHATRRWAKKVKGKIRYFGAVTPDGDHGAQAALEKWLEQKDDLLAGRTPRPKSDGLTLRTLMNKFLLLKKLAAESGELAMRSYREYHKTCLRIGDVLGLSRTVLDLTADDFQTLRGVLAETRGLATLKVEMARVKAVFNFGYDAGLIDRPIRFGPAFKTPSEKAIRRARNGNGSKMFEAVEIRALLPAANPTMKAMILLGANVGFGNNDLATLPRSAVDLDGGWVDHPRPKTGAPRRAKLWPETVAALRDVYAKRPEPIDPAHADLVFISHRGQPMVRLNKKSWTDSVGMCFWALLTQLSLSRPGRGFYALRHTFETIGGESLDQVAVNYIMGHVDGTMAATYRERIGDDRLERVAEHVRKWLFPESVTVGT